MGGGPHIVVLMADDLGLADVGFALPHPSRHAVTPTLDALARSSVHLTALRTPVWCAPARASFLTGRHGWQLGIWASHGWTVLPRRIKLLPELLRDLGYHTALVGKFGINAASCHGNQGFGCGFDEQYGFVGGMSDYYRHHGSWSRNGRKLDERGQYMTDLLGAEARRIVLTHGQRRSNQSLFLWFAPNAPHTPLQAVRAARIASPPPLRWTPAHFASRFTHERASPTHAAIASHCHMPLLLLLPGGCLDYCKVD